MPTKKIRHIFSTATIRTRSTAEPVARRLGLEVGTYGPRPDSSFIHRLRSLRGNVLVVGHSNTVDDIVNLLCRKQMIPGDLPDTVYSKLFIVTRSGSNFSVREETIRVLQQ